jgi:hypothetical protein
MSIFLFFNSLINKSENKSKIITKTLADTDIGLNFALV